MNEFLETNRLVWDELTPLHAASDFYDVAGFRAGGCTLGEIERAEVGDVQGRRLVHLMCHFGLDTLSWARLGGAVTGVDLSPVSVAFAQALSAQCGIRATFVCCDVYDAPARLGDTYDVVFLSRGVLSWLPDLPRWAQQVTALLRPGGTFYLLDTHPLTWALREGSRTFSVRGSYFSSPHPRKILVDGSYAAPDAELLHRTAYEWTHSLGDVLSALAGAGIRIEFVHEFPASQVGKLPTFGRPWRSQLARRSMPAVFSVRGVRT